VIYGHPSHLTGPGDVQCWTSRDGVGQWELCGTVAEHDAESNRGNVAVGLAHNGDLVALVSGWTGPPGYRKKILPPLVCRSSDGGRTWKTDKSAITLPKEISQDDKKRGPIPYGSIVKQSKDKMAAAFYDTSGAVFVLFSEDDGRTWGNASVLTKEYGTETTLLRLRPNRLLAVSRAGKGPDPD
jgi:hypothetical protein